MKQGLKKIFVLGMATLLTVGVAGWVGAASQTWYFSQDTAFTRDLGSVVSGVDVLCADGCTALQVFDVAAVEPVHFPADTWTGTVYLNGSYSGDVTFRLVYWDADHYKQVVGQQLIDCNTVNCTVQTLSIPTVEFTVPTGKKIGLERYCAHGWWHDIICGGGTPSFLLSPQTDPGYPGPIVPQNTNGAARSLLLLE